MERLHVNLLPPLLLQLIGLPLFTPLGADLFFARCFGRLQVSRPASSAILLIAIIMNRRPAWPIVAPAERTNEQTNEQTPFKGLINFNTSCKVAPSWSRSVRSRVRINLLLDSCVCWIRCNCSQPGRECSVSAEQSDRLYQLGIRFFASMDFSERWACVRGSAVVVFITSKL